MFEIRKGINHRNRSPVGVIHELLLGIGAHSKSVTKTTQDPGRIFQGFTTTKLGDLGIEIHGLTTEPGHRHLKTHPGAGGRFGEDQPQHSIAEIDATVTRLQLARKVEQSLGFLRRNVCRRKVITPA